MRLLLAEDERELSNALVRILEIKGYEVDPVYDGAEAVEHGMSADYDGMILDVMMPKKSGIEALEEMREKGIHTPVLMLTAKSQVEDRVRGLESGADDYLAKPFAVKELLARVRALMRRQSVGADEEISMGNVLLTPSTQSLSARSSVRLSNKEFELMSVLLLNQDVELSTEQLLDRVWKGEGDANEDTAWLYISYLKRKLDMIGADISISGEKGGSFKVCK